MKASAVYLYKQNVAPYIKPSLGAVKLDEFGTQIIQGVYNNLHKPHRKGQNPLSAKTIKNIHGVLHKALQQAVTIGYLRSNPSDACILPRVVRKDIKPLEETQITVYLKAISGHRHELLYKK